MRLILDMVHHNPGEPPFQSAFLDPAHLAAYGFNGQVFKHINCIATFAALGVDVFPQGSPDREWLDNFTPLIEREIACAKARGLSVFYHVDLFVLPRRLVELYRDEICDPATGRISLDMPRTLEIHRALFDELSERFPQVDGYIIRVGETYLFDTPHHIGNGPIPRVGPQWEPTYLYDELLGRSPREERWGKTQVEAYVKLIRFLRGEICVRHGKTLCFRTWDIFPDKLHAVPEHYLEVTDQIEPHPNLLFSIKHTALDFWRHVKVNECLTQGMHPQIIEVQCQREYEGKGAYPNYVMDGIINGFEENAKMTGLKNILTHPLVQGIYSWSRGGGWYGPYIQDELWADLNAYVLGRFANDPSQKEEGIFSEYCRGILHLRNEDIGRFRELCLLSARAILKGRHCALFDQALKESVLPTACWMRDDRLGGAAQLTHVLEYLLENDLNEAALKEKEEACKHWEDIESLARRIEWPDAARRESVVVSARYGRLLFAIVHQGWRVLLAGKRGETTGIWDTAEILDSAARYDALWMEYRTLGEHPRCASLYEGRYFSLPGAAEAVGLDESVAHYRRMAHQTTPVLSHV